MRIRHVLAGTAVALLALAGVPAAAQAAPVVPARAVLAAHEFPAGSTGYRVTSRIESEATKPSGTSACDIALYEAEKATAGGRSTTATAERGTTEFRTSVIDRAVIDRALELRRVCGPDATIPGTPLAAPSDLARYRAVFTTADRGHELTAYIGVRGATVRIDAESSAAGADFDAFWQVVRAQVAKVERQP